MRSAQAFIDNTQNLPSPPAIALKILNAVRDEDSSFDKLADIVMTDPALTVQILKIANSSLYGLSKRVESLPQATALIGTDALKNIALSFVIVKNFDRVPKGCFDLNLFWRRSISTAVAAELISKLIGCKQKDIFITALLQEIGVLSMFLANPEGVGKLFDEKRVTGNSYYATELKHFGFSHADIGSRLLERWNLPDSICSSIRYHHHEKIEQQYRDTALTLLLAEKISSIYYGTSAHKKSIEVHQILVEQYHISKEQTDELIDMVGEKAREMMALFAFDPGDIKPFSQIIQETNDELRRLNFTYEQIVFELKQAQKNAEKLAIDLKEANEKLRELAFRDELTGLYNHRYFQENLDSELNRSTRYNRPLSLLLIDIDFFKKVNDTFGHLVGDEVLREVACALQKLVRNCDIVARYGGEEFILILPETGTTGAKVLGQRIRRGIEQLEIRHGDKAIPVTVSIGLASTEMDTIALGKTALIAYSDEMLYLAKRNGRNRLEYSLSSSLALA